MAEALRAVHDEKTGGAEAAADEQGFDAGFHFAILKGRKLVEQRGDPGRINEHDQQIEAAPEQPDIKPPVLPHRAHQPEHGENYRGAVSNAEQRLLEQVGDEQAERRRLKPWRASMTNWL